MYTIVRHAEQTNYRLHDPPVKPDTDLSNYHYNFDYIISSPYYRTRQTAELLNHDDKPIYIDIQLSEYHGHKKWTKLKLTDETKEFETEGYPIPDHSETWEEFAQRAREFYDWLLEQDDSILIVTHGVVVNYLHQLATGETLTERARDVPYAKGFILVVR